MNSRKLSLEVNESDQLGHAESIGEDRITIRGVVEERQVICSSDMTWPLCSLTAYAQTAYPPSYLTFY